MDHQVKNSFVKVQVILEGDLKVFCIQQIGPYLSSIYKKKNFQTSDRRNDTGNRRKNLFHRKDVDFFEIENRKHEGVLPVMKIFQKMFIYKINLVSIFFDS